MADIRYIDDDIVRVYKLGEARKQENLLATLFWGDNVRVVEQVGDQWKLDFSKRVWNDTTKRYEWVKHDGAIPVAVRFRDAPILKVRFIDVGQGDATIIESPSGKLILLDGGEGEYLHNYVSAAWAHVLRFQPLECEAVVVTHGDADHFVGLVQLLEDTRGHGEPLLDVHRVLHSGLVKAGAGTTEANLFGQWKKKDNRRYIVDLVDDLRPLPDARLNEPFRAWRDALARLGQRNPNLELRRIAYGERNAFAFLAQEGIDVQVLGPIVELVDDQPALPYLRDEEGSYSASHTVNGHSVALKLAYGNVRFLFGADLNIPAEGSLLERVRADGLSLAAEVFKVPHHGSHEFSPRMLEAVRPVVSVISSGDESESVEYIHPRAGLVGALGKYSRPTVEKPLVYVTEMVAFFERVDGGHVFIHKTTAAGNESEKSFSTVNGYVKKTYGIVHVRTDGERVLVASHSGKPGFKEVYAFHVDAQGEITFE